MLLWWGPRKNRDQCASLIPQTQIHKIKGQIFAKWVECKEFSKFLCAVFVFFLSTVAFALKFSNHLDSHLPISARTFSPVRQQRCDTIVAAEKLPMRMKWILNSPNICPVVWPSKFWNADILEDAVGRKETDKSRTFFELQRHQPALYAANVHGFGNFRWHALM